MTRSARRRTRSSRCGGRTSNANVPSTGRTRTRLSTDASAMAPAPCERYDDAEHNEQRVEVQAAVLDASQNRRCALTERSHAVQRAIKDFLIAEPQEDAIRNPVQRPCDERV